MVGLPGPRLAHAGWLSVVGAVVVSVGSLFAAAVLIGNVTNGRYTGFGVWLALEYGGAEVVLGVAYGLAAVGLAVGGAVRWIARAGALLFAPAAVLAALPLLLIDDRDATLGALLVLVGAPLAALPLFTAAVRRSLPAGSRSGDATSGDATSGAVSGAASAAQRTAVIAFGVGAAASLVAAAGWAEMAVPDEPGPVPGIAVIAAALGVGAVVASYRAWRGRSGAGAVAFAVLGLTVHALFAVFAAVVPFEPSVSAAWWPALLVTENVAPLALAAAALGLLSPEVRPRSAH